VITIKKNLLLGNGVNQNSSSEALNLFEIKKRFLNFLDQNMEKTDHEVIKNTYNKHKNEITNYEEDNIEEFSNFIFHKLKKDLGIDNNKYRLRRILKKNAIKSIFIKNSKLINIKIDKSIKDQILEYNNVFTLNYYAYWDEKNICDYLHGQVKFIDEEIANINDIAFNPNLKVPKSEAKLIYPSEKLYPRYDLKPGKKFILYNELKEISTIDIFGVSPSGEDDLFGFLNKMDRVKIFIYKLSSNSEEVEDWKNKLSKVKKLSFKDANEFNMNTTQS
jgi:hypothetical protein